MRLLNPYPCVPPSVDHLDNIHELLLVVHGPVNLIVVTRSEVNHVFVSEEKHDRGHRVYMALKSGTSSISTQ